jgi:hypothetical protein
MDHSLRTLIAAAVAVAALVIGPTVTADAARPQPDPTSYVEMARYYKCGEYQKGPHTNGYLYRTWRGYVHTDQLVPTAAPYVTCMK